MNNTPGVSPFGANATQQTIPQLMEKRRKALQQMGYIGVAMVFLGVCCIIVGILTLVLNSDSDGGFPISTGSPIWSGIAVLGAGILGIIGSRSELPNDQTGSVPAMIKCKIGGFYGMSISLFSLGGLNMGYSIANSIICGNDSESCSGDAVLALVVLGAILGLVTLIAAMFGAVFFCYYARTFNMRRYNSYQDEERIAQLEHQIRQLQAQQQGGGTTAQVQPPPAYGSYNNFGFNNAPPAYNEKV